MKNKNDKNNILILQESPRKAFYYLNRHTWEDTVNAIWISILKRQKIANDVKIVQLKCGWHVYISFVFVLMIKYQAREEARSVIKCKVH